MSLWQRKNQHKRYLLWLKLYGVCFLFHCIILLWVFFVHDNRLHHVALSLHKNIDYSAPILFVPVSQHVAMQHTQTPQIKKAIISSQKEPVSTIKPSSPEKNNATTVALEKKEPEQEKKVVTPEPLKPKPSIAVAQQQQAPAVAKKQPVPAMQTKNIITKNAIPENAIISHNYKEVEALRRASLLQKELVHHWKPPIGMPTSAACDVSFFVDTHGKVKNITMAQSSGIMMYDISARQALFSMKMPQWTYGKNVTITFKA
jgi:outer membrane biosynthesis protein TonB